MGLKLSDLVRTVAKAVFVEPARNAGNRELSIAVKDLMRDLETQGFPRNHTPQICSALQTGKFLSDNGLEIIAIDGPASKTSTTVVFHYRIKDDLRPRHDDALQPPAVQSGEELPADRAKRHIDKLRSMLKLDLARYGGAEGFMRWVRGHDEED